MSITPSMMGAIRKDQRNRFHAGNAVWVECYLQDHPSLNDSPAELLDLIYQELALRQECGDNPQLTEYLERFGQFERHLRAMFESPRTQVASSLTSPRQPANHFSSAPTSLELASGGPPLPKTVDSQSDDLAQRHCRSAAPGYEIVRELGRGAMGVVYQARQHSLKRHVALKMLLAGPYAGATTRTRFRTEAEAVARLQHPNIVQIYEIAEHDGRPFLCLEYVDGGSLQQKVTAAAVSEHDAATLLRTLALAMQYTHERGILHRDLKPTNILLTADGTPKITDFGFAKLIDAEAGPTRTEAVLGTPNYMSPEQAAGHIHRIGPASDIYSLGAILYELLTGRVPFQGTTLLNTLEQVRTCEPVPPRRLHREISLDLQTICLKCLEKEPSKRYGSGAALADDLSRFLEGRAIRARPIPLWERAWRGARRRPGRVAWGIGIASTLCLLVTACWYFGVAGQLSRHRAETNYQTFVQRRNDAMFFGLLSPEQGALLTGADVALHLQNAETAAREALALAGIDADSKTGSDRPQFDALRHDDTTRDCYVLLLVLASVRTQQAAAEGDETACREALRILDRACRLGFETRTYHVRRAAILERLGDAGEARAERDRAESLPVNDALDHFLAGEDLYRSGDSEEALHSFNRALTVQPGHFWAQFFASVCHLKAKRWETAKAGLNACLTQQPDFVWGHLFRSFANEKLHDLSAAESDLAKALAQPLSDDARYVLFLWRGILRFNQRDLPSAAGDFEAARALKPSQYNAYFNLAQVCLAKHEVELADDYFQKAMGLNPPAAVIAGYHTERGDNLLHQDRYEDALEACRMALSLAPRHPVAHAVRARALLAIGQFDEAEAAFDECLRNGQAATTDVYRGRGQARMRLGKYLEAVDDYTRALERAPDADIYHHRGWAHFFADGWKLALRDFSMALDLNPELGDAYIGRGLARVMLGDVPAAVEDAEAALRRNPATSEIMHNIACVFALAAARIKDTATVNSSSLVESYRNQAAAAVRKSLDMTPAEQRRSFWRDKVVPDMALIAIHDHPEFQRLQELHSESPARP